VRVRTSRLWTRKVPIKGRTTNQEEGRPPAQGLQDRLVLEKLDVRSANKDAAVAFNSRHHDCPLAAACFPMRRWR